MKELENKELLVDHWRFTWYHLVLLIVNLRVLFSLYGMDETLFSSFEVWLVFSLSVWLLHYWRWFNTRSKLFKYSMLGVTWLLLSFLYMVYRMINYHISYTLWGVLFAPINVIGPYTPTIPLFWALYLAGTTHFRDRSFWLKIVFLVLVPLAIVGLFFGIFALGVWHDSMRKIFYIR